MTQSPGPPALGAPDSPEGEVAEISDLNPQNQGSSSPEAGTHSTDFDAFGRLLDWGSATLSLRQLPCD